MAQVAGWIHEENLNELIGYLTAYVDNVWDDLDDDVLLGALEETDSDKPDRWFEYPTVDESPVTVALARDPGSSVVMVRISGPFDEVLAARVATLLDVF
jgi:hypothetical protein